MTRKPYTAEQIIGHLRQAQVTDNLLCRIMLSGHDTPFLMTQFLTTELSTIQGGRSGYAVKRFVKAVNKGDVSPVPADTFLYTNAIFDALYESGRLGREVAIDLDPVA
tara:strand:- start:96 stop:419 length:324 start_codon:yes stop_codon:yes gene_type:complete